MIGLGVDEAPIRWIILQLLHNLHRRLKTTPDGFGLKSSIAGYLTQFTTPKIDLGVGSFSQKVAPTRNKPEAKLSTPARDHSKPVTSPSATVEKKVAAQKTEEPAKPVAEPESKAGRVTLGGSYYNAEALQRVRR